MSTFYIDALTDSSWYVSMFYNSMTLLQICNVIQGTYFSFEAFLSLNVDSPLQALAYVLLLRWPVLTDTVTAAYDTVS